jgi:hypothetical protein
MLRLIIAALVLVLVHNPVLGEEAPPDYIETFTTGEINWKTGKISAAGFSEPSKKKTGAQAIPNETLSAARKIAADTLAGLIGKLRLSGSRAVLDVMESEPLIAEKIGEMVRSVPVVKQNFLSDGAVEIVIEMSIYGGFAQLILPDDIRHIAVIKPVTATKNKQSGDTAGSAERTQTGGLVIDARGLGAIPAMMFTVLDENGKPVYGSAYVSREYAVQWGMAEYVKRIPPVNESARVTPNPLVIKGLRAVGAGRTDIVISNADAIKLKGAVENLIFLRKGRVAVVLD